MKSAIITNTNGTRTMLIASKKDQPSLEQAQSFVGGTVEMMPVLNPQYKNTVQVLANEEGRLQKNPIVNPSASSICGHPIVGDCVVLNGTARWK